MKRIVLIGLRGSGKTTVGRNVAGRIGWRFVDCDAEIVSVAGRSIKDIFASDGEAGFRRLEKSVLARLCEGERVVLATGGGAVLDPENVAVMRRDALVVHLDAPVEVLWKRVCADSATGEQRPALTNLDGCEEMKAVAEARAPLYAAARHAAVDAGAPAEEVVAGVIEAIEREGRPEPK